MKKTLFVLFVSSLIGCHTAKVATTPAPTSSSAYTESLPFCYGLIQQSVQENENVFLSPTSAAIALRMLVPGANGNTLNELQSIVPEINITSTEHLQVASALWINNTLKVKPAFLKNNPYAEVFRGEITTQKVNQWASDRTNGKVTRVLTDPLPPIVMALTNALYFKADWVEPFDERNTRQEAFHGTKGENMVNMMHQTTHFQYTETNRLQAVRLYYTSNYCMDIYLPREGLSVGDVLADIQTTGMAEVEGKKVRLSLPKFKLEYEKQLNDYLQAMGLKTCFSHEADFSGISDTPLYVDFVKQSTYLSINETGTEAAAVTAIGLAKMAYRPEPEQIYDMVINRPFLFLIRDGETDQILFYGVIQSL